MTAASRALLAPDLGALLSPQSVAVIGASPDTSILRGRLLDVMLRHPFEGRIHPISRSHAEVQGLRAYPSIDAVPEVVDLAVLLIPADAVPDELERCADAGVRAAHILSSGFAEQRGERGRELQRQIREIARRRQMAVCGPNSEGFANLAAALCPTFSPVLTSVEGGLVPEHARGGQIAVVAQSGGIGFSFYDRGRIRELPFRYVVTTGNEACLDVFDVVDQLLDEGGTDVFLLFLEDIKNAATFRRVAQRALQARKPLIATKIGRSDAGRRAAASHTAALAGSYATHRAMFRRYGVVEAHDPDEMLDIAAAFSCHLARLPQGRRVGICTGSGGGGGWMADACAAAGLEIPELDPETRARIDPELPAYGTSQNPVDGTAQAIRAIGYAELARRVAASPRIDAVVVVTTARNAAHYADEHERLLDLGRESRKPILLWSYTTPSRESTQLLARAGLPLYSRLQGCARAMAALADYRARREHILESPEAPERIEADHAAVRRALGAADRVLCEYEARPVLTAYGIGDAEVQLCQSADAALAAAAQIKGPVALKVQSPDIAHKTEVGGVALGLETGPAVREAYERVLARTRCARPDAEVRGVLVQPMAPVGRELIVGVHRDPTFGPIGMLGLGGVDAELRREVVFAPCPIHPHEARAMLAQLPGAAAWSGSRGQPPADVEALVDLLVRVSQLACDQADLLAELDLNPVLLHERGAGVSVVDAWMVRRRADPAERTQT